MGRSNDFLRLYYAGNIVERIGPATCSRSTRYVKHWIVVLTRVRRAGPREVDGPRETTGKLRRRRSSPKNSRNDQDDARGFVDVHKYLRHRASIGGGACRALGRFLRAQVLD